MTHPAITSGRLVLYLAVCRRARPAGRITSKEIAHTTGINATQVRRDLGQVLGSVGKRGGGYGAVDLASRLEATLADHLDELEAIVSAAQERADQLSEGLAYVRERVVRVGREGD